MNKINLYFSLVVFILIIIFLFFLFSNAQTTPPKPGPVSNIIISDITTSSLKISWDPATNTDYYNVYRGHKFLASTTKTFYEDKNLIPNSEYVYIIESVNAYYGASKKPGSYGTYVFASSTKTLPLDYPDILAIIDEESPLNVYRGYGIYKGIYIHKLATNTPGYYISLATQTPDLIVSLPDFRRNLEDKAIMNVNQKYEIYHWTWQPIFRIQTTTSTPLGLHKIKIRYGLVSASTQEKEIELSVNVIGLKPVLIRSTPLPSLPPLPAKSIWEKSMINFGEKHCHVSGCCGYEGSVWYYDGLRVFYNILDYTKNSRWWQCVSLMKTDPNQTDNTLTYRERILQQQGHSRAWQIFTTGLRIDYERTLEQESKQAVYYLSSRSPFANLFYIGYRKIRDGISSRYSRETAYAILAQLDAIKLGLLNYPTYIVNAWPNPFTIVQPRDEILRGYVDMALGHIDQWFNQPNSPIPFVQPFMFGLTAEALITYYEDYEKDPRIPIAIKQGLDWIWENMITTSTQGISFFYKDKHDYWHNGREWVFEHPSNGPTYDLNLLIAPAYAWYYNLTGDEEYIRRGDLIWEGGVKGAWLGGGKQFSQTYRWSFKYLEWRDGYKLTPYIPPTSSFLSDYRQYLKVGVFSQPEKDDILNYSAYLRNISTTTLIRTRISFPLPPNEKYIDNSAYLTINNIRYPVSYSYTNHQLRITIPYLAPREQALLRWKMRR